MTFSTLNDALVYHQEKYEVQKQLEALVTAEGYQMIEPAYFEDYDQFIKLHQRVKKRSMVKLNDAEGVIRVLRPDITTSMMRDIIPKWHNGLRLKLFYNTTVFQYTPEGIKEQKQFGLEALGKNDASLDRDVMRLILRIFSDFKLSFMLEISYAPFLNTLIAGLNINDQDKHTLKDIIYHKNQAALEEIVKTFKPSSYLEILKVLFDLQGSLDEIKTTLNALDLPKDIKTCLNQLNAYKSIFEKDTVTLDLSLLSAYDYYSGLVFKGYLKNHPAAVLKGGRYNTKAMGYEKDVDAIGFSFSLAALLEEVMRQNGK